MTKFVDREEGRYEVRPPGKGAPKTAENQQQEGQMASFLIFEILCEPPGSFYKLREGDSLPKYASDKMFQPLKEKAPINNWI